MPDDDPEVLARALELARRQLALEVSAEKRLDARELEERRIRLATQLAIEEQRLREAVKQNTADIRVQAMRVDEHEVWRRQVTSLFLIPEWKPEEGREMIVVVRDRMETKRTRKVKNFLPVLIPTCTAIGVVFLQWRLSH